MIEYKQYWSFVGGEKPKDSLAIAEKMDDIDANPNLRPNNPGY